MLCVNNLLYHTYLTLKAVGLDRRVGECRTQAVFTDLKLLHSQIEQNLLHRRVAESILLELHDDQILYTRRLSVLCADVSKTQIQVYGQSLGVGMIYQRDTFKFGG